VRSLMRVPWAPVRRSWTRLVAVALVMPVSYLKIGFKTILIRDGF
jgi:hypothetical protein